ncbi:MAG: hypothetical protein ACJ73J_10575 [Actinomycetes bacterium]
MRRHFVWICAAVIPVVFLVPTASADGPPADGPPADQAGLQLAAASGGGDGTLGSAAARALDDGYLVPDEAEYAKAKAAAATRVSNPSRQTDALGTTAPTALLASKGLSQAGHTPSDSTGAIGTTRYIETINSKVGIYDRTGSLINSDSLSNFWAETGNNNFDPQVMWDATTERFYYSGDSVASSTDNRLAFGFSKSASPNNATTDWCHYQVGYGSTFPDYPKLGDSRDFALIGVNVFTGNSFTGSDILGIGKPAGTAAITTCPDGSSLTFGSATDVTMGNGVTAAFTPVPATEVDASPTGFVVA